jgi:hypothetical protein
MSSAPVAAYGIRLGGKYTGDTMKNKLTAILCALFLVFFSYVAEAFPSETRAFLWHVAIVAVLEALISAVNFRWPGKKE